MPEETATEEKRERDEARRQCFHCRLPPRCHDVGGGEDDADPPSEVRDGRGAERLAALSPNPQESEEDQDSAEALEWPEFPTRGVDVCNADCQKIEDTSHSEADPHVGAPNAQREPSDDERPHSEIIEVAP